MSMSKLLPKDTNAALKEIMRTITILEAVFAEETKLLQVSDTKGFMALQDRKISAAQMYESHMQQMIARKNEIKKADPGLRDRLKKQYEEFSQISAANMMSLERMQRTTQRLGDTIRNAAIQAAQQDRGYSYTETGSIPSSSRKKAISSGHSETV